MNERGPGGMVRRGSWIAPLLSILVIASPVAAQDTERPRMRIATAGSTGLYYAFGSAICKLYDREFGKDYLYCDPRATQGTIFNIVGLWVKEFELAIVQPDWAYFAYRGENRYRPWGAFEDMRMLFSGVPEMFTVLSREPQAIDDADILAGARISVGDLGSGSRASVNLVLSEVDENPDWIVNATTVGAALQARALCANRVDAIVYIIGHPNPATREATSNCPSFLVSTTDDFADLVLERFPFYQRAMIPGGLYEGNPNPTQTIGMQPIVAVRADMPEQHAYDITKTFFERFDDFRVLHRAFADLKPTELARGGEIVPFHPGAERYLQEAGLR